MLDLLKGQNSATTAGLPLVTRTATASTLPLLQGTEGLPRLDDLANQLLALYAQGSQIRNDAGAATAAARTNVSNQADYLLSNTQNKARNVAERMRLNPMMRVNQLAGVNTDIQRTRADAMADVEKQNFAQNLALNQGQQGTMNTVLGLAQRLFDYQMQDQLAERQNQRSIQRDNQSVRARGGGFQYSPNVGRVSLPVAPKPAARTGNAGDWMPGENLDAVLAMQEESWKNGQQRQVGSVPTSPNLSGSLPVTPRPAASMLPVTTQQNPFDLWSGNQREGGYGSENYV